MNDADRDPRIPPGIARFGRLVKALTSYGWWVLFAGLLVLGLVGALSWRTVIIVGLIGALLIAASPIALGVVIAIVSRRRAVAERRG